MTTKNDISKDKKDKLKTQLEELEKLQQDYNKKENIVRNKAPEFYFTEISPIQIYIQSNIPNKEPWVLKRSNFITDFNRPSSAEIPKDYSEYPFFTNEVEYPTKYLYKMEPYEIYDFFFSRSYFEYKLNYIIFQKGLGKIPPNEPGAKRRAEYNKKNMMTMLQLLFTTVYPHSNNITNSIDEYINKKSNTIDLNRILSKPKYTYMKIDGNEYTVMKLTWLNDIFNHPKYNKLADEFISYKYWCISQSKIIQKKIDDNIQKIENLIVGFDFVELLDILKQKIEGTDESRSRAISFEQEIFKSNVASLSKIINIINAYRIFIIGKKRNNNIFLDEAIQYSSSFKPYIGQTVEVCLDEIGNSELVAKSNIPRLEDIKKYWYYGKIIKKDETPKQEDKKYIVQVFYKKRNEIDTVSINVSISLKNIREPILQKILENKNIERNNLIIEKLRENGPPAFGIDFSNKPIDPNTFYYNINNILMKPDRKNKKYKNNDIFEDVTNKLTFEDYSKNPQFYRYKIKENENLILRYVKIQYNKDTNITNIFLNYLDMLDETYNKVKSNINFTSRMKNFIDSIIKLHKIILPIKAINDLYLNNYKIDIQHKDITIKDVAAELTKYKDFVNFVIEFLSPNMESSNTNLQSFILAYAENTAGDNFIKLMDILESCYSDKKPSCKIIENKHRNQAILKYIDTDVNYININNKSSPQYEVYININLILGNLDNTNWPTIKCNYSDEFLTRRFNQYFNKQQLVGDWIVIPDPFIEIENKTKKVEGTNKKITKKTKGGNNQYKNKNYTRRRR